MRWTYLINSKQFWLNATVWCCLLTKILCIQNSFLKKCKIQYRFRPNVYNTMYWQYVKLTEIDKTYYNDAIYRGVATVQKYPITTTIDLMWTLLNFFSTFGVLVSDQIQRIFNRRWKQYINSLFSSRFHHVGQRGMQRNKGIRGRFISWHWTTTKFYFDIEWLQRGSDLRIYNIQPNDAGTYICLVSPTESELTHVVGRDDDSSWSSSSGGKTPAESESYLEGLTIVLKVRTTPGPVNKLSVRLSTILGVLMWEFTSNNSGGYPIKSFTAEFRKYFDADEINATLNKWHRLDPENIPANVVRDTLNEIILNQANWIYQARELKKTIIFFRWSDTTRCIIWFRIRRTNFGCGPIIIWVPEKLWSHQQQHLVNLAMKVNTIN